MKSRHKTFFILISLILLTRLVDGITTYIGTPDLRYELNPIVSVFKQGWIGLFLFTGFITCVLMYGAYKHYFQPLQYDSVPKKFNRSAFDFAIYSSFGLNGKANYFLYKLPNLALLIRWIGFTGSYTLLFYGFFVIINNLLLIYPSFLTKPWIKLGLASQLADVVFITLSVSLLTIRFFKQQYRQAMYTYPIK